MESRFDFIDYAKIFGIFFICIGHFLPENNLLKIIFYSFHVPVFFFISGFLFKQKEFHLKLYFQKQINRILKPYIIYFIISALLYIFTEPQKLLQLPGMFLMLNGRTLWNDPLWFLPVIFLSNCLLGLLYQLFKKLERHVFHKIIFFVCCSMFFFTFLFDYFHIISMFLGINLLAHMFGYTCVGVIIRALYEKIKDFKIKTRNILSYFSMFFFFLCCLISGIVNNGNNISVYTADFNNILFYIPFAILLCIFFIFSFFSMKSSFFIKILSENTIFIMCSHYFILLIYKSFFSFLSPFLVGCFVSCIYIFSFKILSKKAICNKYLLNLCNTFQIFIFSK